MQEEIDLTKYLDVIIRRWYIIIGIAVAIVAIVAGLTLAEPKAYKARALVAMIQLTMTVSFETSIETSSEAQLELDRVDRYRRQNTFRELVRSPKVAADVLEMLGDRLDEDDRDVATLLKMVESEILENSDLIAITVTSSDPELAVSIANTWGSVYVHQINELYGGLTGESYTAVKAELIRAREAYAEAQGEMEAALEADRLAEIQRAIDERNTMISALTSARRSVVSSLVSHIQGTERLLRLATDLKAQVEGGESSASTTAAAALILMKVQAFGQQSTSAVLELEALPTAPEYDAMGEDLKALVDVLQERLDGWTSEFLQVSSALIAGEDWPVLGGVSASGGDGQTDADNVVTATISALEEQVRELNAAHSREDAHFREIRQERDLARETYETLLRKDAELAIVTQTSGAQIRLVAPAASAKELSNLRRNIAAAILLGMGLGLTTAFAIEYWKNRGDRPPLDATLT